MALHALIARNTASESSNLIHSDEVARRYGFRGGLVPGVTDYAYLTRPVVERWEETMVEFRHRPSSLPEARLRR